jgi:hypothetical protein
LACESLPIIEIAHVVQHAFGDDGFARTRLSAKRRPRILG